MKIGLVDGSDLGGIPSAPVQRSQRFEILRGRGRAASHAIVRQHGVTGAVDHHLRCRLVFRHWEHWR
jgi:hypothetical protein